MLSEEQEQILSDLVYIVHCERERSPFLTDEELTQKVAQEMEWGVEETRWLVGIECSVYQS